MATPPKFVPKKKKWIAIFVNVYWIIHSSFLLLCCYVIHIYIIYSFNRKQIWKYFFFINYLHFSFYNKNDPKIFLYLYNVFVFFFKFLLSVIANLITSFAPKLNWILPLKMFKIVQNSQISILIHFPFRNFLQDNSNILMNLCPNFLHSLTKY